LLPEAAVSAARSRLGDPCGRRVASCALGTGQGVADLAGRRAISPGRPTATREERLAAELEDWRITSHRTPPMGVRRDKPPWVGIAVTKTDLDQDEVDEVVHYYSTDRDSPFGDKVRRAGALAAGAKGSRLTCSQNPARAATASRRSRPSAPSPDRGPPTRLASSAVTPERCATTEIDLAERAFPHHAPSHSP
jgi:hypothetical protein